MVRAGLPTTVGGDQEGYVTYEESLNQYDKKQGNTLLDRVVGAVEKVLPNAVSAAKGALAQLSYSGSTGNFTTAIENITLSAKFQRIVDQAPNKVGSPLCKNVYINTLSGFVLCEKPVFQSSIATAEEESAIEEFMSKGFFYE